MGACLPILYQTKAVYPPAGVFPSAEVVADALTHTTADVVLLAPPFVEEMCRTPEILDDILADVDSVFWIGGPIPKSVGDGVTKRTKLWTMIGMTEASVLPTIRPVDWPHDDWQFVRFNPDAKIELRHSSDDLYEAVIARHPDPERAQPCFKTFPDLAEWGTKDLYSPHPSKPDLWLPGGRADDIIVFLNGEKTNPTSMEQSVAEHPEVRAALVIGRLRLEAALLIELEASEELSAIQRAQAIERIWPAVEKANQVCPAHAKVSRSHILFTDPQNPMPRSGKGTVQRQPTLDLYAGKIESLYRDADEVSRASDGPRQSIDIGNRAAVLAFVRGTIRDIVAPNGLEDSDDFFAGGMDSLQALQAARALKHGLYLPDIETSTIYTNPSVWQLTERLLQLSTQREDMALNSKLSATLKRYTGLVDDLASFRTPTRTPSEDRVVILTGSTGGIGCYLLQILLENPSVSHIYCLNRSSDSASRQKVRSGDRGLPTYFPHRRVTFLTSDLSVPSLGLDDETYYRVRDTATDIIHSAWPVNFNLALDAFRPHLYGVVCLLSLACISPSVRSICFLSSTSTVAGSRTSPVPEQVLADLHAPAPMGYAQSKYLAERILDYAAHALPSLDIKVARVGQVAGPAVGDGVWNRWEWVPSLVVSSSYLGAIPTSLGKSQAIDWLPVDVLAPVLIELALGSEKAETGAAFFHPSNPKLTSWEDLLPSMIAALDGEKTISKVSFADWLQRVKSAAADDSDLEQLVKVHPAVKLVRFYESLLLDQFPPLEMGKALQASEKLRDAGEIRGEWMQKWVKGWIA